MKIKEKITSRDIFIIVIGILLAGAFLFLLSNTLYFNKKGGVILPKNQKLKTEITPKEIKGGGCVKGGCNGELCVEENAENAMSVCVILKEHACYREAICERQSDGNCGWRQTEELKKCLREN